VVLQEQVEHQDYQELQELVEHQVYQEHQVEVVFQD
jgi:hypothetical protein